MRILTLGFELGIKPEYEINLRNVRKGIAADLASLNSKDPGYARALLAKENLDFILQGHGREAS
jgi:hypothetical protein